MDMTHNRSDYSTSRREVLEIIRELPDSTSREIASLMPHMNPATVAATVNKLKMEGIVIESGSKVLDITNGTRTFVTYAISPNPTPVVARMKRTAPSEAALHLRIKELEATIAELRVWKDAAISRYPDLAVSPIVLKARKLVAEELRAGGDPALAEQVSLGRKDDTLMMRVTIKALEEVTD